MQSVAFMIDLSIKSLRGILMKQIKRLFQIDPWKISNTHLDKENLRLQE